MKNTDEVRQVFENWVKNNTTLSLDVNPDWPTRYDDYCTDMVFRAWCAATNYIFNKNEFFE